MQAITTIQLYSNSVTPSIPSGGYLDCDEKTTVPLNFAISEIRDLSKKKGTFSKSIVLPGTKNNHKLLNNYFDVNIEAGTFDINRLQQCSIIQDGVVVLDNAIIQLVSVNKSETNGLATDNITYTVLVKDSTSDFFTAINNKFLNDIDMSDLDHVYTADNVVASFNNTVDDGYKYVMPYNSPDLNTQGADTLFNLEEFTPSIYAKKYFDKIFAGAGYSYNWPGLTGADVRFDKLVIPYNGDVIRTTKEESSVFTASANRVTSVNQNATKGSISMVIGGFTDTHPGIIRSSNPYQVLIANNETNDPSGNYNPTTGIYTTPNVPSTTNSVKVKYTVEYEVKVVNTGGTKYLVGFYNNGWPGTPFASQYNSLAGKKLEIVPNITVKDDTIPFESNNLATNNRIFINQGQSFANGTTIIGSGTQSFETQIPGLVPGHSITLNTDLNYGTFYTSGSPYILNGGQTRYCWNFYNTSSPVLYYNLGGSTSPATGIDIVYTVKNVYVDFISALDGDYGYNVPLKMNKFVPQNIKQSDFVKSILTMFNLYVEVDPDVFNRLNIYGRNEYYDNGKIEDWTKKLVKDKPQEIKFIPEITNKKQLFTYKQDEDWANKRYKEATNEIYGQAQFTFDNEYVKEITTTELLFSPTPVGNTVFGAVCPIWNGQAPQTNIRILYDGGALPCNSYTIQNYPGNVVTPLVTYPCLTHWDKPTNPTFDLNWLPCDFYFRSDNYGSDTNNNLFNLHWRRTMNQINSGKIMSAYFDLNSYDIQKMKLSDKIRIDNSWWNINSIKDYDANSRQPTKVELISIDDNLEIPFVVQQSFPISKGNPLLSIFNDLAKSRIPYVNTILSDGNIDVKGRGNLVTANVTNSTIFGDNNVVTQDATVNGSFNQIESPSIVYGDYNAVPPGSSAVIIVGTGITGATSGGLFTNNIVVSEGGTINNQPVTNVVGLWEAGTGVESIRSINTVNSPANDASGDHSIAIGGGVIASGAHSQSFGFGSVASGPRAHAEGSGTEASGSDSHAEGSGSIASGNNSHAEGNTTEASGDNSHAEGEISIASGIGSHAEGLSTTAVGDYSHAQGDSTTANGDASDSAGVGTIANSYGETVVGNYSVNLSGTPGSIVASDSVFRVGNGTSSGSRSDAFRVYKNGAAYLKPITPGSIASPVVGMVAFNTSTNTLQVYNGTAWVSAGGAGMTYPTVVTSVSIDWTAPFIYNTPTSPGTGNITSSNTGANLGIVQKIYHNAGTAPTVPANWVLLSGTYTVSQLNIIYAEYSTSTRVEYWII